MARAAELRKAEITAGERTVSRHQRLHGTSAKTAPLKGVAGQLLFGKIIVGKGFILVAENFFCKHKKHLFKLQIENCKLQIIAPMEVGA